MTDTASYEPELPWHKGQLVTIHAGHGLWPKGKKIVTAVETHGDTTEYTLKDAASSVELLEQCVCGSVCITLPHHYQYCNVCRVLELLNESRCAKQILNTMMSHEHIKHILAGANPVLPPEIQRVTEEIGYIFNCNGVVGCFRGVTAPSGQPDEWTDEDAGAFDTAQAEAFLSALAERGLTVVSTR